MPMLPTAAHLWLWATGEPVVFPKSLGGCQGPRQQVLPAQDSAQEWPTNEAGGIEKTEGVYIREAEGGSGE